MTTNKINFRHMYNDVTCRLCELVGSEESLEHFTSCSYLIKHFPDVSTVHPDDIYADIDSQIKAMKIWTEVFNKLEDKIKINQEHI